MSKGFLKEFREFAIKGNMVDLAVGVIIGAAFGKIIDSLVKDVIMPLVNFIIGGNVDFSNKFIVLSQPEGYTGPQTLAALQEAGATIFAYGNFITILINFILLAFVVFLIVKSIAKARARFEEQKEEAPAPTPEEVVLLREIRDALKKN
jgi:large conductance mechanosensitive channel